MAVKVEDASLSSKWIRAIVTKYGLKAHRNINTGYFGWVRRMGIHMAYHQNIWNKFHHLVFTTLSIPLVMISLHYVTIQGFSAAAVLGSYSVAAMAFCDAQIATFMAVLYWSSYAWIAVPVCAAYPPFVGAPVSLGLFALATADQIVIGHGIHERGVDDSNINFGELFGTVNPTYFLLLPFYTYAHVAMAYCGYRPQLSAVINDITVELRRELLREKASARAAALLALRGER